MKNTLYRIADFFFIGTFALILVSCILNCNLTPFVIWGAICGFSIRIIFSKVLKGKKAATPAPELLGLPAPELLGLPAPELLALPAPSVLALPAPKKGKKSFKKGKPSQKGKSFKKGKPSQKGKPFKKPAAAA